MLGRDETGTFRKVLTITPNQEQLVGTKPYKVRLVTSVEASSVTCDWYLAIPVQGVVITQNNELILEAVMPMRDKFIMRYAFTATIDTESSWCEALTQKEP